MALDVDALDAAGRWVRHVPVDADPLGHGKPPADNRWQRGYVVDALHLGNDEDGVWAEWYRHLAEAALPPAAGLPRDLRSLTLGSVEVADLTHEARLRRVGLTPPSPGRRTWPGYQRVGEQLHQEGWGGLLAPSAARPESLTLCLFLPLPENLLQPERRRRVTEPATVPRGLRT